MKKIMCLCFLLGLLCSVDGQSNVYVANDTNAPVPTVVVGSVVVSDVGDVATAQHWFLQGLVMGSGLAAIVFGFMMVRRALAMGDNWND